MTTLLPRKTAFIVVGVLYTLMIAIGSIPGEAAELGHFFPDYVLHFTAYGAYAALIAYGLGPATKRRALIVLAAIAIMGALDEAVQFTLSYRSSDIHDWKVDMLAALTVAVVYMIMPRGRNASAS